MRTEKKELNVQIGKRLQTARENSGYTQETFAAGVKRTIRAKSFKGYFKPKDRNVRAARLSAEDSPCVL